MTTPWTRRAGQLARESIRTLGRAARSQTPARIAAPFTEKAGSSSADLPSNLFVNPIAEGADPTVVPDGDRYLWCQAEGNVAISIWVSDRLTSLGSKHVIWWAPDDGPCSQQVWAPELVKLDGRWHVYFAASDGNNRNHRTFVLVADTDNPLGTYTLHGPLFTGDEPGGPNGWSIDLTILEHGGRRYAVWSGWPDADTDVQHLYAAEMTSPTEITAGRRCIAESGVYVWERIEERPDSRGLLEGPRVLKRDGRTFIVYSCAASWLPTYKLGMLELTGDNPLDAAAWTRSTQPVFQSTPSTYGVGHGSCLPVGAEWWHVFHSKIDRVDGWRRTLHVQPLAWSADGRPDFGVPMPRGKAMTAPAHPNRSRRDAASWAFPGDSLDDFDYYGHHQYVVLGTSGLELGRAPHAPVNAFRSAEKILLRDGDYGDVEVETTFSLVHGDRAVGVLVRATGPAIGFDTQRGYFVGVALDRRALVIGKTDGHSWTSLAETTLQPRPDRPMTLRVSAQGDLLVATCIGAAVQVNDSDYRIGTVGVRVVDTHARFTSLSVHPLGP